MRLIRREHGARQRAQPPASETWITLSEDTCPCHWGLHDGMLNLEEVERKPSVGPLGYKRRCIHILQLGFAPGEERDRRIPRREHGGPPMGKSLAAVERGNCPAIELSGR